MLPLSWPWAPALVHPSAISGRPLALNSTSTPVPPRAVSPAGTRPVCPALSNGHHTHHNTEPTPSPISGTCHLCCHMLMPKRREIVTSLCHTPHPASTLPPDTCENQPLSLLHCLHPGVAPSPLTRACLPLPLTHEYWRETVKAEKQIMSFPHSKPSSGSHLNQNENTGFPVAYKAVCSRPL